ncbi:WhiB family transcriptional regulator [Streptomyces youssoufiensis]
MPEPTLTLPGFLDGRAACAQPGRKPDTWHSVDPATQARARAICRTCPLLTPCRTYARNTPDLTGTWGALTRTPHHPTRPPTTPPCGTLSALRRHRRTGQTCTPCENAHATRVETDRRQRLDHQHALGGTPTGYALHRRLGEPPCDPCLTAERQQSAARRARRAAERAAEAQAPGSTPTRAYAPQTATQAAA